MAKAKVKIINQSETGLNTRLSIDGKSYTNNQAYQAAKNGRVEGYHGVQNKDGVKFIRSNPDKKKSNNLG